MGSRILPAPPLRPPIFINCGTNGRVFRLMIAPNAGAGSGSAPVIATGGYNFPFGFPVDGGSTGLTQTGVAKLSMFVPSIGMTVSALAFSVTGATGCASGSPCEVAFGIYNSAGALLGQKLAAVTATGAFLVPFNPAISLTAGSVYYFAWAADSVKCRPAGGRRRQFALLADGESEWRQGRHCVQRRFGKRCGAYSAGCIGRSHRTKRRLRQCPGRRLFHVVEKFN